MSNIFFFNLVLITADSVGVPFKMNFFRFDFLMGLLVLVYNFFRIELSERLFMVLKFNKYLRWRITASRCVRILQINTKALFICFRSHTRCDH